MAPVFIDDDLEPVGTEQLSANEAIFTPARCWMV
jgi:hypothetical protein